jgi:YidC/Oxa1 family membrane protein insertase
MLTSLLFLIYLNTRPKVQNQNPPAPVANNQEKDPLLRDQVEAEKPSDKAAEPDKIQAADEPAKPVQESVVTLGSMDPTKNYNLLITLSSRGASVERAELIGQHASGEFRYKALEHKGGYLGYLGLVEVVDGLRVRVVPDGSPAAAARGNDGSRGFQVGDIITEIDGGQVLTNKDVELALEKTKPGKSVEVKVNRGDVKLVFDATLSDAPLDLLRSQPRTIEQIVGNEDINGLRTTIASINSVKIPAGKVVLPALAPTLDQDWEVKNINVPGGEGVEFRMPLSGMLKATSAPKLEMVKRYRLYPVSDAQDGYLLDLETVIENQNDQTVNVAMRQEGPTGLTLEGWWYSVKISQAWFSSAGHRDIAMADKSGIHLLKSTRDIFAYAKKTPSQPNLVLFGEGEPLDRRTLNYIGLDSQYFNASLMPHVDAPDSLSDLAQAGARIVGSVPKIKNDQIQAANVAFWVDSKERPIGPGQSTSYRYSIFLGPKDSTVLAKHKLEQTIEYGWFPWVAKPLGGILHIFYAIVRNYGLAIVLLTVCVRLALFPLGRRAAITGQRMQELQPEIKKINEKYQDMQKRAQAMQELYAKHDFKPLAGCLPMFLQLPIFIGLYRCLSVDVSLRQEPLIPGIEWCSNLAGPDQLYNWSGWMMEYLAGRGTGWLGPYLNILPLITVALFLAQQYFVMPKATDPQTQMTQTMMKWMTAFMAVMFFKVPAGLCIYFITSSIWSLIERQIVKRTIPPPKTSLVSSSDNDSPPSKPNRPADRRGAEPQKQSAMDKMRQLLEKPAVRSGTQRGTTKKPKGKK